MEIYKALNDIPVSDCPTALTVGKFEGVHLGHQRLFRNLAFTARERGLQPAVLSFLNDPRDITGDRNHIEHMIYPVSDRARFIRECGIERVVFIPFGKDIAEIKAEEFVSVCLGSVFNAGYFTCGEDFRFGKNRSGDIPLLRKLSADINCEVEVEPHMTVDGEKVSSSSIARMILAGEFRKASNLLGRDYFIEGEVCSGNGIGTELGFPTLNICYPSEVLVPEGIFAGWTLIDGKKYPSAVNSGKRPTVVEEGVNLVEVHLLSDSVPLNVRDLTLYPVEKIRDEVKFSSREELKAAIARDCEEIRRILKREGIS